MACRRRPTGSGSRGRPRCSRPTTRPRAGGHPRPTSASSTPRPARCCCATTGSTTSPRGRAASTSPPRRPPVRPSPAALRRRRLHAAGGTARSPSRRAPARSQCRRGRDHAQRHRRRHHGQPLPGRADRPGRLPGPARQPRGADLRPRGRRTGGRLLRRGVRVHPVRRLHRLRRRVRGQRRGRRGRPRMPRWRVFPSNPNFTTRPPRTPTPASCGAGSTEGAECDERAGQQRRRASRGTCWRPSLATFTTLGNNASTAISEVSFLSPDTMVQRPVSPDRQYDYAVAEHLVQRELRPAGVRQAAAATTTTPRSPTCS